LNLVIIIPLSKPANIPTIRLIKIASPKFNPALKQTLITAAHMAIIEPMDISIKPVIIINVIGSVIIPTSMKFWVVSSRFDIFKKLGERLESIIKTINNKTKSINSQLLKKLLNLILLLILLLSTKNPPASS
jgi:hypothetical protein